MNFFYSKKIENYNSDVKKSEEIKNSHLTKKNKENKENNLNNSNILINKKIHELKSDSFKKRKYFTEQNKWKNEFSDLSKILNSSKLDIKEDKTRNEIIYKTIASIVGKEKYELFDNYLRKIIKCQVSFEELIYLAVVLKSKKTEDFIQNLKVLLEKISSTEDITIIVGKLVSNYSKHKEKTFFKSIVKALNSNREKIKDDWLSLNSKIEEVSIKKRRIGEKLILIEKYLVWKRECEELEKIIHLHGDKLSDSENLVLNSDELKKKKEFINKFKLYIELYDYEDKEIKQLELKLKMTENYLLEIEEKYKNLKGSGKDLKLNETKSDIDSIQMKIRLAKDKNFLKSEIDSMQIKLGVDSSINIKNLNSKIYEAEQELDRLGKVLRLQHIKSAYLQKTKALNQLEKELKIEFNSTIENELSNLNKLKEEYNEVSKLFDKEMEEYFSLKNDVLLIRALELKKNEINQPEKIIETIKEDWKLAVNKTHEQEKTELRSQKMRDERSKFFFIRKERHIFYQYRISELLTPEFLAGHFKVKKTLLDAEQKMAPKGRFGGKSISRPDFDS